MMFTRRRMAAALGAGAIVGLGRGALAQAGPYPTRPVKVVVPFGAGSSVDATMRLLAPKMSQALGQPLIIDNKAGATGVIGSEFVARSAPDGYTICMGTVASHATVVPLSPKLPYDVLRDFTLIGQTTAAPAIIVINTSVPARTLAEFVAWSKTQPSGVDYASMGVGGSGHLATELLAMKTGAKLVHVPYNDAGRAMSDLVGGQVKAMIYYSSVIPFVQAGQLRALAVMHDKRLAALPQVPTTDEQGISGITVSSWQGLFGPAGMPDAVRDRIFSAMQSAVMDPEIQPQIISKGGIPAPLAPAQFRAFVQGEIAKWTEVVRVGNIKMT